jgi:hypothetical protein
MRAHHQWVCPRLHRILVAIVTTALLLVAGSAVAL